MKKSDRISALIGDEADACGMDRRYTGFFTRFNAREYYEAHDVLEHLWLRTEGGDRAFFQGLIQLAGAFVHLQKNFLHPEHPKHAARLRPAVRLFRLAAKNLAPYAPRHRSLDVAGVLRLCRAMDGEIVASDYARNPWRPTRAPRIQLGCGGI